MDAWESGDRIAPGWLEGSTVSSITQIDRSIRCASDSMRLTLIDSTKYKTWNCHSNWFDWRYNLILIGAMTLRMNLNCIDLYFWYQQMSVREFLQHKSLATELNRMQRNFVYITKSLKYFHLINSRNIKTATTNRKWTQIMFFLH